MGLVFSQIIVDVFQIRCGGRRPADTRQELSLQSRDLQQLLSTAVVLGFHQFHRGRLWAGGVGSYMFFEMDLIAGKSDAVAMVLKGILPGFAQFFGFCLQGKVFLVLGLVGQASLIPLIAACSKFKERQRRQAPPFLLPARRLVPDFHIFTGRSRLLPEKLRRFHTYRLARQSARGFARQSARGRRDKVPVDKCFIPQAGRQSRRLSWPLF